MENKKNTLIDILYENEEEIENKIHDDKKISEILLDFSIDNSIRIKYLDKYYSEEGLDNCFEILSRICGIYELSGIKIIELFLYKIFETSNIPSILKIDICKSLFRYEESEIFSDSEEEEGEEVRNFRIQQNKQIQYKNQIRKEKAYDCLNSVCSNLENVPTPCSIDSICILMNSEKYKLESSEYFSTFLRAFSRLLMLSSKVVFKASQFFSSPNRSTN